MIGTALVLLLIKLNLVGIWKFWLFSTLWITLTFAFAAFINNFLAAVLAFVVSVLKLYKPNVLIQNVSEIFVYGGLAAIFVQIVNLFAAFMLLILISIYDYIAVYKTKHMVTLANFQSKSNVFAGLFIPYEKNGIRLKHEVSPYPGTLQKKSNVAVLGGGDIGFPLIFAGVVMSGLMMKEDVLIGFFKTLIIPAIVSLALLALLIKGQHNKFYPAMPVLSLGCFVGYVIVWLI